MSDEALEKWVVKLFMAEGAKRVVSAEVCQLDSVGEAALREEGILHNVVVIDSLAPAVEELGMLEGNRPVKLPFTVIHDDECLMLAIAL